MAAEAAYAAAAAVKPCGVTISQLLNCGAHKAEYAQLSLLSACLVCKANGNDVMIGRHAQDPPPGLPAPAIPKVGGHVAEQREAAQAKQEVAEQERLKIVAALRALYIYTSSMFGQISTSQTCSPLIIEDNLGVLRLLLAFRSGTAHQSLLMLEQSAEGKSAVQLALQTNPWFELGDFDLLARDVPRDPHKTVNSFPDDPANRGSVIQVPKEYDSGEIKNMGSVTTYLKQLVEAIRKALGKTELSADGCILGVYRLATLVGHVSTLSGPAIVDLAVLASRIASLADTLSRVRAAFGLNDAAFLVLFKEAWFSLYQSVSRYFGSADAASKFPDCGLGSPVGEALKASAQRTRDREFLEANSSAASAVKRPAQSMAAGADKKSKSGLERLSRSLGDGGSRPHTESKEEAEKINRYSTSLKFCQAFWKNKGQCELGPKCPEFHLCWWHWRKGASYDECCHHHDACSEKKDITQFLEKRHSKPHSSK